MTDRSIDAFGSLTPGGRRNVTDTLRAENTGAILLAIGTVLALIWANSPWHDSYTHLGGTVVGPAGLHLDLTIATWATDGLLTTVVAGIGFTVALLIGELSFDPGTPQSEPVEAGILIGSLVSAVTGGLLLIWRSRGHERRAMRGTA